MFGNLAPSGAIIKEGAVDPEVGGYHRGPAICFDSQEEALAGIEAGKVKEGHVVVIRYEGPKGGPVCQKCLRQLHKLSVAALVQKSDSLPMVVSQERPADFYRPYLTRSSRRRSNCVCRRWRYD